MAIPTSPSSDALSLLKSVGGEVGEECAVIPIVLVPGAARDAAAKIPEVGVELTVRAGNIGQAVIDWRRGGAAGEVLVNGIIMVIVSADHQLPGFIRLVNRLTVVSPREGGVGFA